MATIFHDVFIKATNEAVFKAVSEPTQLIDWWPLTCSGVPKEGAEYNFHFSPKYDWYGQVSKIEQDKSFHIKMTNSDEDWDPTSFCFDIEEAEGGVWLHFCHKDWTMVNQHFRIASYCWAILLKGLKNYVENGEIIPFEKRE